MQGIAKLLGFLSRFALAFEPPTEDLDLTTEGGRKMLAWRTNVAGAVTLMLYVMVAGILWSIGYLPFLGSGFARAGEVTEVRAEQLAQKIDTVEAVLCMERADPSLVEYRRELRRQYREVKGHEYETPPCEVLLKIKR